MKQVTQLIKTLLSSLQDALRLTPAEQPVRVPVRASNRVVARQRRRRY